MSDEYPIAEAGRTYRVTGPHPVHGTRPGMTFTKCLDPAQEHFLIVLGHVEIVEAVQPDSVVAVEPDPDTQGADGAEELA